MGYQQLRLDQGYCSIIVHDSNPVYYQFCSDASGLGYILLLNDQPMIFAPDSFIMNRLGSYGQMFNMVVRVEDGLLGPGTLLINSTIIRYDKPYEAQLLLIMTFTCNRNSNE